MDVPDRNQSIGGLERDQRRVRTLIRALDPRDLERPGIGGGEWSPKDLVGHLASWEQHAIDAIAAWSAGRQAPIDRALAERGVHGVNAETTAAVALRSCEEVLAWAEATHRELLSRLRALDDGAWRAPAWSRARRPLGLKIGSILGGPGGPFAHADAHMPDLVSFVTDLSRNAQRA